MAPIKFEENIKDKLEKRTLQPSSNAWNQLSEKLDVEDKKGSRSLFFYFGIAASIVGILLVTTLFFKSSEEQTITPIVVESNTEDNQSTSDDAVANSETNTVIQNKNTAKDLVPVVTSIKNELKVAKISEEKKENQLKTNQHKKVIETKESIVVINEPIETKSIIEPLNSLTLEEVKVIEVVNQIKKLETENGTVTNAEIEDLLKQAEKEILRERIYNETTRTVDADALLQDVEEDLEQSFRTRVFESLKSSYKTVKTAVAERNN